jgi:fucose permease
LLTLALLTLVPAGVAAFTPRPVFPEPAQGLDLGQLAADYHFWLAVVAVFGFYALETSALRWSPKYLEDVGLSRQGQVALIVSFWVIFLAARLGCVSIDNNLGFTWLVLVLALASASLLGNMAGMYQAKAGATSFLLLAGCLGPIFPTLAGLIVLRFPTQPAVAFGLVCALGNLGRILAEPATDQLLRLGQIRLAMGVSLVMGLIVFFPLLLWVIFPVN